MEQWIKANLKIYKQDCGIQYMICMIDHYFGEQGIYDIDPNEKKKFVDLVHKCELDELGGEG